MKRSRSGSLDAINADPVAQSLTLEQQTLNDRLKELETQERKVSLFLRYTEKVLSYIHMLII